MLPTNVLALLALLAVSPMEAPSTTAAAASTDGHLATDGDLAIDGGLATHVSRPDIHELLQLQYVTVVRNAQPSPAETGFLLRRARVSVAGTAFLPSFGYRAELELAPGSLGPLDLFAELRPAARWSIRFGQVRVPFSRNWTISEDRLTFAERSVATEEFRYDYDTGILANVSFLAKRLQTYFGVFNGAGRNAVGNDNVDPLFVARVTGTLGSPWRAEEGDLVGTRPPSVTLGVAATLDYVPEPTAYGFSSGQPLQATAIVARDTNGNGRPDGVRVFQLEGDLSFRWRGLAVDAEGYFRREEWGQIGADQPAAAQFLPKERFGGMFAQATYYVLPARLEAGARVAVAELSPLTVDGRQRPATSCTGADGVPFACALPFTDQRSELTLVAVGHWFGHGVQVSGMYSALWYKTARQDLLPWSREQRFLAQTQLAF